MVETLNHDWALFKGHDDIVTTDCNEIKNSRKGKLYGQYRLVK